MVVGLVVAAVVARQAGEVVALAGLAYLFIGLSVATLLGKASR